MDRHRTAGSLALKPAPEPRSLPDSSNAADVQPQPTEYTVWIYARQTRQWLADKRIADNEVAAAWARDIVRVSKVPPGCIAITDGEQPNVHPW